ncbi:uncharacterized protein LOC128751611 [Synchiropus splendidus]|uniref:uncharacterized protein LOC128751611 n=1 Tax=Synchiropus splendidus TaxID=270530 RepID=UPI00237EAC4B|nr:uncharacterized protein LOC128751611 [Synchiropus splendidus]
MDHVPLKIPPAVSLEVTPDVDVVLPDYLLILQETQYDFALEKWVLTGLQKASSHPPQPVRTSQPGVPVSCPPYWMMLSSLQQSRPSSDSSPQQRSRSLSPELGRSDSKKEVESRNHARRKAQKAFVPDLHNPPSCLSSLPHQRRKNLRQYSLVLVTPGGLDPSSQTCHRGPNIRSKTFDRTSSMEEQKLNPWIPGASDSTVDLISALSPEERDLVGAITSSGYPLHTAIAALQKPGWQTPEQILSYVVACEHLCQLGHDMALVEEALEMFQNCEAKAREFLQLLSQFNEMGFHQSAIKEVLLVNGNHRERALEELMMRVA